PGGLEAAHERLHGPASDALSLVGAELILVKQVLAPHDAVPAEIDQPQVGVETRSDVALVCNSKARRDVGRGEGGDVGQIDCLGPREQELARRLASGDPAPDLTAAGTSIELRTARRWVLRQN